LDARCVQQTRLHSHRCIYCRNLLSCPHWEGLLVTSTEVRSTLIVLIACTLETLLRIFRCTDRGKVGIVAFASLSVLLSLDPLNGNTMVCRLFRLLKPVSQLSLFSDLEIIFHALSSALLPMLTVLALISFVFILMSIIGMSLYGERAFQRRCVWAGKCCIDLNSNRWGLFCARF